MKSGPVCVHILNKIKRSYLMENFILEYLVEFEIEFENILGL
jgi:hypothetical protein